ncbi:MAG: hypothetical protein Q8J68_08910 [Methanolobus sp.]|uniref:hypothetical protein n=1 Tax=Methanolobus sp. TaxID=1874737 RepID=UPI00272FD8CC|nr:hypothetical protein [Methanolobus sp.]MDP2217392.1 hypothetical protein [Methanolobus sp.]
MVIIEGTAFPLDKINENGWGIPASEAENAVSSLRSSVVRICSRDTPHGCDFSENPENEIGRIIDAWVEGDLIKARAEITDSTASRKILDRVWEPTWSVYGRAIDTTEGWVKGFSARAMTLVRDPAWKEAVFSVAASKGYLVFSSRYTIIDSNHAPQGEKHMTNTNQTPPAGGGNPAGNHEDVIASKSAEIKILKEELEKSRAEVAGLREQLEKTSLTAAGSLPADKVHELIASQSVKNAEEMFNQWKEEQARNAAIHKYSAARARLGLPTDATALYAMSAKQIEALAAETEQLTPFAARVTSFNVHYPADGASSKSSVGKWNEAQKKWEDL